MLTKANMPLDRNNNPIPILPSLTATDVTVPASAAIAAAIALSAAAVVVYIETDQTVRLAFGGSDVDATANDIRVSAAYPRHVAIPKGATHISFIGAGTLAAVYMEEQG